MNTFLSQMQQATEWIEAAAADHLHPGQLYMIDEAAKVIVGTECDVVVVPNGRFRYATLSWPFDWILSRLNLRAAGPPRPIVIFFPPQERDSLLLLPLFVHELGHSAVLEHSLVEQLLASHFGVPRFDNRFDRAAGSWARAHRANRNSSRIVVGMQLRQWTTELICDALAAKFFGLAYVLAFSAVVASESADELQDTHPPTVLRVRAMLRALSSGPDDWVELGRRAAPNVIAWLEYFASRQVNTAAGYEKFLVKTMDEFWSEIDAMTKARLQGNEYQVADYLAVAPQLQDFLRARVLPAQLEDGSPAPRRAIITAGWFHVLDNVNRGAAEGDSARSLPQGLRNADFQTFLEKAVEMSRVLEEWRTA